MTLQTIIEALICPRNDDLYLPLEAALPLVVFVAAISNLMNKLMLETEHSLCRMKIGEVARRTTVRRQQIDQVSDPVQVKETPQARQRKHQ